MRPIYVLPDLVLFDKEKLFLCSRKGNSLLLLSEREREPTSRKQAKVTRKCEVKDK
jgi:hypothetical protein